MEEVGISIFMTTATTALAFGLGCWTTIPAVQWLCIYGLTTIVIDFVWQITFFVALMVLDERRIRNRRRDILICYKVPEPGQDEEDETSVENRLASSLKGQEHLSVVLMRKYTNVLLIPWVKGLVIVSFAVLLAVCIWSASMLSVKFNYLSIFPSDSYVIAYVESLTNYTQRQGPAPFIYFRLVEQSDPYVQEQMETYVDAIVNTSYITAPPYKFWLRDFNLFKATNISLQNLPFNETLHLFLDLPDNKDYKNDIVLDSFGNILASRTMVHMDNITVKNFNDVKDALPVLQSLTSQQPMNQHTKEWPLFSFEKIFLTWEFFLTIPYQLKKSTIVGIISVTLMSIFFMPHWSGVLFVGSLTTILCVDFLGILQFANIEINGASYVSIVMAIGLLVDYVMHVTLRFQESCKATRNEKARDVLESTGASVLLGGMSTFLAIIPLVFASSDILMVFVISLVSVVLLGLLHGLMFLPVVLSLIGPIGNKSQTVNEAQTIQSKSFSDCEDAFMSEHESAVSLPRRQSSSSSCMHC
jgi:Niemann-Pick C1 protein